MKSTFCLKCVHKVEFVNNIFPNQFGLSGVSKHLEPFYFPFLLFLYILKHVSIYFSCLEECCNTIFL